jgi:DNA helicase-2/ATP-dependent DNA helicase PcrA
LSEIEPRVSLMTIHAAKGLEFDCVFVSGLEEELLPHARSLAQDYEGGGGGGLEEERRLFYVALTRARERVFLSHALVRRHFGSETFTSRSRFLDELPPELVEGGAGTCGPEAEREALGAFQSLEPSLDLREGQWVDHDHFGRGRIVTLVGSGANARASVLFTQHGTKQLLLQYAKLRPVEEPTRPGRRKGTRA